jgi:hypothetical protein
LSRECGKPPRDWAHLERETHGRPVLKSDEMKPQATWSRPDRVCSIP